MLQLKNTSPFAPAISSFPNRDGVDTLYVVAKGTFVLSPHAALAADPVPPVLADEYWGDPAASSLKYASELHLGKPGTDVVLVGNAWARDAQKVTHTAVRVTVAERQKTVWVFGNRVWKRFGASEPEPFESKPLVFERAFGGQQKLSQGGRVLAEERNPVGVGFAGKRSADEMLGERLPNLEDPRHPIERPGAVAPPACFGFVAPSWLPRRAFAGTYDQKWQRTRSPYLPRDFDPRFFNCAAPELAFDRHLDGGEPVEVLGASRAGPLRFHLPRHRPTVEINVAGSLERPPFRLETVLLEPDANRMCLTWRVELPCDKKILKVREVAIGADRPDLPVAANPFGQAARP